MQFTQGYVPKHVEVTWQMPGPLWKSDGACMSTRVQVSPKSSTARGAVTIPVMLVLSLGLQWDFMVGSSWPFPDGQHHGGKSVWFLTICTSSLAKNIWWCNFLLEYLAYRFHKSTEPSELQFACRTGGACLFYREVCFNIIHWTTILSAPDDFIPLSRVGVCVCSLLLRSLFCSFDALPIWKL